MLEVSEVDVFYGKTQILRNLTFNVKEGQIVFLIGPNGHGKTTILKTISGLLRPRKGCIKYCEEPIHKMSPNKVVEKGIVHVPQGGRLFPNMTVQENLFLGGYTERDRRKRQENLELVYRIFPRLEERKNQLCRSLSSSERKMVAVGRGLMSKAKLLMIDEPSLGLAPVLVDQLYKTIDEEITKMGITLLLVEQNIRYVTRLADYIYVIEQGKVSFEGSKEMLDVEDVTRRYFGTYD